MRRFNPFHWFLRHLHVRLLTAFRFATRHPKLTVTAFALTLLACVSVLPKLTMLMSIDDLADQDFQTYKQLKDLKSTYYDQDEIFIIIRPLQNQLPTKGQICAVSGWIQTLVDTRGDINAVISTLGISRPVETQTEYRLPKLLDIDCTRADTPETEEIQEGFRKISESPFVGTLTSKDARDLAILIYPEARVAASMKGTFNPKIIDELKESFETQVLKKEPELSASWTGDGIFQYHLHRGYEHMPVLNLIISLLTIFAFRIFFGTFKSSFIFLAIVTWTTLPLYAGMAIAGHPIDVLSSAISLMIFIGAIEDFIFLSHFMKHWSWSRAIPRVILPSFCTSQTTALGFGSLMLADLDIIRRFGLWAAVGSLVEWLMMFVFLPALLTLFPKWRAWVSEKKSFVPKPHWLFEARPPKWLTYTLLLVFPLSFFAAGKLHVSDSPEKLLPPTHEARRALDVVEETRGWRVQISLVFNNHDNREFNEKVIDQVKAWPLVSQVESPYETLDYMTKHLSEPMQNYTAGALEDTTLNHRIGPRQGQSRALLYVKNLETTDINKMRKDITALCPQEECWLAGSIISYGELGERILGTLYESLTGSLVSVSLVILFMSLCFRPREFPALVLSSLWGPVSLLLVFYLFRVPVSYVTSMIASIVVGLAGDNAVHFMMFANRKTSLHKSVGDVGPASLTVTICTVLASTSFFFGYFYPMRTLGLMMIVGLVLSFFGDILILRGLSRDST